MNEAAVAPVEKPFQKRNLKAAATWMLAAGVGALLSVLRYRSPILRTPLIINRLGFA